VRARRERYVNLTISPIQECPVRRGHLDNCAGCENLGGRRDRDSYADLTDRKCTPPTGHPVEEGPANRGAHATRSWAHAIAYELTVQSSPRGPGSRTSRVHRPAGAACLVGSGLHRMQVLAGFEPPKFGSEGRPACEGASRKGARPCPLRPCVAARASD
jgi:hypothetical protein